MGKSFGLVYLHWKYFSSYQLYRMWSKRSKCNSYFLRINYVLVYQINVFPILQKWQWELGAIVLYFAWIDFILYLRRFPRIGIYIVMVTDILSTFWKFSFVLFLFLVGSGFSLYVILQNQVYLP